MPDVFVKEGFELLAIVSDGDGCYTAIIKRNTRDYKYVTCFAYDITNGSWGNGYYSETYAGALEHLKKIM